MVAVFARVVVKTMLGKKLLAAAFKEQFQIVHHCWLMFLQGNPICGSGWVIHKCG
jgi:hypothetical protein